MNKNPELFPIDFKPRSVGYIRYKNASIHEKINYKNNTQHNRYWSCFWNWVLNYHDEADYYFSPNVHYQTYYFYKSVNV